MNEGTSFLLAAVLAAGIGAIGYAGVGGSGAAWQRDLAERQAAFRAAEADRIAEAQAAEQARLQAEVEAEAEARTAAQAPPATDAAAPAIAVTPSQAAGGGYDPLAPSGRSGGYDPLAPSGGGAGGTAGYDPTAPRRAAPAAPGGNAAATHPEFGLPDTEGVDIVYYTCTACHSAALFSAQRLTPQRWDEVLTWMVETQNMAEPPAEDREIILDYLVRHFSTQSAS